MSYSRDYYLRNRERLILQSLSYYYQHREQINARHKAQRQANLEAARQVDRERQRKHREKMKVPALVPESMDWLIREYYME